MESVSCSQCGSQETKPVRTAQVQHYGRAVAFCIVRCARCSLVYLNPRPNKEEITEYYPRQYHADYQRIMRDGWANPIIRAGMQMIRRRRTPPVAVAGRLLDIGCNSGYYLAGQRQRGWDVQGIEIDAQAAEYARTQFGLPVQTGDSANILPELPDAQFDVVTLWHVLEHLFDPASVLQEVYRILKPGGLLMLEVPNFGSPLATIFGQYWFPLEVPRHLYHFTPDTLKSMLTKAGLGQVQVKGVPSPEAINWSLGAWRNKQTGGSEHSIAVNPLLTSLSFPISWGMAQFNRSDAMSARAVKPPSKA